MDCEGPVARETWIQENIAGNGTRRLDDRHVEAQVCRVIGTTNVSENGNQGQGCVDYETENAPRVAGGRGVGQA